MRRIRADYLHREAWVFECARKRSERKVSKDKDRRQEEEEESEQQDRAQFDDREMLRCLRASCGIQSSWTNDIFYNTKHWLAHYRQSNERGIDRQSLGCSSGDRKIVFCRKFCLPIVKGKTRCRRRCRSTTPKASSRLIEKIWSFGFRQTDSFIDIKSIPTQNWPTLLTVVFKQSGL